MQTTKEGSGHTLPELMVVLLIVAVAAGLSAPGFASMIRGVQVGSARDALRSSLQRARHEAIRHSTRVVMCTSAAGSICGAGDRWHQGWIIFHDSNYDGQRDASETVIHREAALPGPVRVMVNPPTLQRYVSFVRHGTARTLSYPPSAQGGALLLGSFGVCTAGATGAMGAAPIAGFKIVLRRTGHTRVERRAPAPCV